MDWFYDNNSQYPTDSFAEIDRIYCLLFDSFTDENWQTLEGIYAALPGKRYQSVVPYWYGLEESASHLSVSVEPVGLQAAGMLPRADWLSWDEAFRQLVENSDLPRYELN